jgi:hypothetical protein
MGTGTQDNTTNQETTPILDLFELLMSIIGGTND